MLDMVYDPTTTIALKAGHQSPAQFDYILQARGCLWT